ncbi:MAG: hypothetical protein HY052_10125 [Proteobacteria bacterium]|nr:hypothetical protein [Pseudomonadota bacterium]
MTDEQPPKSSSKELRTLRDEFSQSAKNTLNGFEKMITEAEQAEKQRELDALLSRFLPENGRAILPGHDIVFLINKSKDMGGGMTSSLGVAMDTLYQISGAVKGVKDVTVSGRFWGKGPTSNIWMGSYDGIRNACDATGSNFKNFLPVAKETLVSNLPDLLTGRQTHYIVVCDGTITDSIENSASMLGAAAQFNPKATFDFIVIGAEKGNIEGLAEKMQGAARFSRVTTAAEVADGIMTALKTRIAESPVPVQEPVAKPIEIASPPEALKPEVKSDATP